MIRHGFHQRFQALCPVSHQDAVSDMFQHRIVIGTVPEHITVLQGCSTLLAHQINGCRLASMLRDHFSEILCPVNEVKVILFQKINELLQGTVIIIDHTELDEL